MHLNRTLLEKHTACDHHLLIGSSDIEIPSSKIVRQGKTYVAGVESHGHHRYLLDDINITLVDTVIDVVVDLVKMSGRMGIGDRGSELGSLEIECGWV
jgi:hypothetical protein